MVSFAAIILCHLMFHVPVIWSRILPGKGTFFINGIFPISHYSSVNFQSGIMMAEAMRYAVDRVNNDTGYLHGYQIAVKKVFDLGKGGRLKLSDMVLSTFILDIPFLIGPFSSETSYVTSILTGAFKQNVVSYGATYSDFDTSGISDIYMTRTVPSDKFRIQATLDLLHRLKWNYIGLVNSYGYNGEREARYFVSKLSSIGICLAEQVDLPRTTNKKNYDDAIKTFLKDRRLKAILLFTTIEDSRSLFESIKKLGVESKFYSVCIYGCTNYVEVTNSREEVVEGALSLDLHHPEVQEFKKYFLNQKPLKSSPGYFKQFWEELFNCSMPQWLNYRRVKKKNCTKTENITVGHGYYPITPIQTVVDAVYGIANAIKVIIEQFCNVNDPFKGDNGEKCDVDPRNRKLYSHAAFEILRQMSYNDGTLRTLPYWLNNTKSTVRYDIHSFQRINGAYVNAYVGKWEVERSNTSEGAEETLNLEKPSLEIKFDLISLAHRNESSIESLAVCSEVCPALYHRVKDINILKAQCCWTCRPCPYNSISLNDTCKPCKQTEKACKNSNTCKALPAHYLNINSSGSIAIILLSIIGLCFTVFGLYIFLCYNHVTVIRASGRDLCVVILLGISMMFICPFAYHVQPSVFNCIFRGTLPGLSFLVCYATLFLKTNRIYRIFSNAKVSVSRPVLISSHSQFMLFLGIVAVQLLLACVWFASKMPGPKEIVSNDSKYIRVHCKGDTSPVLIMLNLILSVVFMFSCTVLAFKTRSFPKNYNEAKYIGLTLYITCVAWAVFFPAYFLAGEVADFLREYLMCAICIIIGYISFFGLFGQKIKILFIPQPEDTRPQMLSVNHTKSLYTGADFSSSQQDLKTHTDEACSTPPLRLNNNVSTPPLRLNGHCSAPSLRSNNNTSTPPLKHLDRNSTPPLKLNVMKANGKPS